MKKNILLLSLLASGVFFSCTEEKKVEKEVKTESVVEVVEEVDGLSLNNGEKWVSNEETHEGMMQIKVILENMDPLTLEDYHLMGEKCDEQTAFIISNCTMEGEAHNQLHFVLHPILENVDGLLKAENIEEGKDAMNSLHKNLSDYFSYFEL